MKLFSLMLTLACAFIGAPVAQAIPVTFFTTLSGAAEAPPNASLGTGSAVIVFDTTAHTMSLHVQFSGLTGNVTASHIHCCTATPFTGTAGVATVTPTFTGFPSGVTSGVYDRTFDMTLASSFNAAFLNNAQNAGSVTAAELALFNGALNGNDYLNIHTNVFPGGEIRGFLRVPEPASLALLGLGLFAIGFSRRKRAK